MGSPAELKMSLRGPRGAIFCFLSGNFGRLFRVLFVSVFLGRFGVDFCNIFATFSAVLRQRAPGRRQRRRRRRGGRLRLRALLGWDLMFLPSGSARPATSNEVRRIYKLPPLPPASQTWTLGGLEASISIDCHTFASIFVHLY